VVPVDLASEMEAARKRRAEKTARQLCEARAYALRASLRPGATRAEVEERARSFYPHLSEDLLDEAIGLVCEGRRGTEQPTAVAVTAPAPAPTPTPAPAS
jgi:hypothetical protein